MSETPIASVLLQETTPNHQYIQPDVAEARQYLENSYTQVGSNETFNLNHDDIQVDPRMWDDSGATKKQESLYTDQLEASLGRLDGEQIHQRIQATSDVVGYLRSRTLALGSIEYARHAPVQGQPLHKRIISLLTGSSMVPSGASGRRISSERELIEQEAVLGGRLFGAIPAGHRREFFMLDNDTWVWHEESVDVNSYRSTTTSTRYEIHQNGILMAQGGSVYRFIEGQELREFAMAIQLYYETVARELYQVNPFDGRPLIAATI